MAQAGVADNGRPFNTYFEHARDFPFNGEPVMIYHDDGAHTDGGSMVMFRRSDVIVAGDAFLTTTYPVIDAKNGGSVAGIIRSLNRILDLAVPSKFLQEGGTYIIPGHGRIADEADVVEYRDMVVIVSERIADMVKKGMTLEQVKAARPTHRLRPPLRRGQRSLDDGDVRRGDLRRDEGDEVSKARAATIGIPGVVRGDGCRSRQAGWCGRGRRRAAAPVDLTGYWVSVVTEDWRWRMLTPPKGDAQSVPINAEGKRVTDAWDLERDNAAGLQCKAFGVGGIMRQPGRLHITWQDDSTLKVDTDAGTQTRLLNFDRAKQPPAEKTWQGFSVAEWQGPQRGRGAGPPPTPISPTVPGGGGSGLRGGPPPTGGDQRRRLAQGGDHAIP